MLQCVAVCCSVLQCVAVCCSVLQCVAVRCSALQCVAVCCSVLQCVAVCCSVLQCAQYSTISSDLSTFSSDLSFDNFDQVTAASGRRESELTRRFETHGVVKASLLHSMVLEEMQRFVHPTGPTATHCNAL